MENGYKLIINKNDKMKPAPEGYIDPFGNVKCYVCKEKYSATCNCNCEKTHFCCKNGHVFTEDDEEVNKNNHLPKTERPIIKPETNYLFF